MKRDCPTCGEPLTGCLAVVVPALWAELCPRRDDLEPVCASDELGGEA